MYIHMHLYKHTWALRPFKNLWENVVFVADPTVHMSLAHKRNLVICMAKTLEHLKSH